MFLRGTVSSGLFQHGHVTSHKKLETPAAGSTDSTYTRNKLRLSTERQCHQHVIAMGVVFIKTVYSDWLHPASCAYIQSGNNSKTFAISAVHFKTRNLKVYVLQVGDDRLFPVPMVFSSATDRVINNRGF